MLPVSAASNYPVTFYGLVLSPLLPLSRNERPVILTPLIVCSVCLSEQSRKWGNRSHRIVGYPKVNWLRIKGGGFA
jgi:hypothetical protein